MPTESQAIQLLEELGLTEYEARCFVALTRVPTATAKEISDLSDVPRSRVYDAVDRLHRRGLVDVQQSDPREYRAIGKDEALDVLRENYTSTLDAADDALAQLDQVDELEESGAWAISDSDHVTNRIGSLIADADDEVYVLLADDRMLDDEFRDVLAAAGERGVRVFCEVPSAEIEAELGERLPDAAVVATDLADDPAQTGKKWLGRMLMVDRRGVLLSGVAESALPGQLEETAIWAEGTDHGLVVGVHHLLGARIDSSGIFE